MLNRASSARLPKKARKSTTLDNGRETHLHFKLRICFGYGQRTMLIPTHHGNEGQMKMGMDSYRCYFPKGTDFTKVSDEDLEDVVWELNNRPRKILQYKTAQEVFDLYFNLL